MQSMIKQIAQEGMRAWTERKVDDSLYQDDTLWLLPACSRLEAENLLNDLPTGTFLIQPRTAGFFALSIYCRDKVNHCIIYETNNGYGFSVSGSVYESLRALVHHYAQISLEEHNDELFTTLKYPVFASYIRQLRAVTK